MPNAVKVTMVIIVISMKDFALHSCSSVMGGSRGSGKICCSGVVCGWAAASVQ